jgi:hypothetical protein
MGAALDGSRFEVRDGYDRPTSSVGVYCHRRGCSRQRLHRTDNLSGSVFVATAVVLRRQMPCMGRVGTSPSSVMPQGSWTNDTPQPTALDRYVG